MRSLLFTTFIFLAQLVLAQDTKDIAAQLGYKINKSKGKFYLEGNKRYDGPYDSIRVRYFKCLYISKDGEGVTQREVSEPYLYAWRSNGTFDTKGKYIEAFYLTGFQPSPVFDTTNKYRGYLFYKSNNKAGWSDGSREFTGLDSLHFVSSTPYQPGDDYLSSYTQPAIYGYKNGCIQIVQPIYPLLYPPVCGIDDVISTPNFVGIRYAGNGRKTFHRLSKLRLPGGPIVSEPYDSVFTAYGSTMGCINREKGIVEFFFLDSLLLKGDLAQINALKASAKAIEISYWQQRDVAEQNDKRRKDSIDKSIWNWYAGLTMFTKGYGAIGLLNEKGDTILPAVATSIRMFGYIYKNADKKVKAELMYGEKGENIVFWEDNKLRLKERIEKEELRVEIYAVDRQTRESVGYFFVTIRPSFKYGDIYPGTGTCGLCNGEKTVSDGVVTESRYRVYNETVKTGTATSVKKYSERKVTDANGKTYNYTPVTTEETDLYKTQRTAKKETYTVEKRVSCPRCKGTGELKSRYLKYDKASNEYIYIPRD